MKSIANRLSQLLCDEADARKLARKGEARSPTPIAADLYCDLELAPKSRWRLAVRGLTVTAFAVLAAAFVSDHYGTPLSLTALLMGLGLNFLGADRRLEPGLQFASSTLLKAGVVAMGGRVALSQIIALGPGVLCFVLLVASTTILVGVMAARILGYTPSFGLLAGGAVAICGASAALALAALLGERRADRAQLAHTLIGVSIFSAFAMLTYPIVAREVGLNDAQAGFFLGASIHDVAQTLGAGYAFSEGAGQFAIIVKLLRVSLLVPLLAILGMLLPRMSPGKAHKAQMPWFILGFAAMVALNSLGLVPGAWSSAIGQAGAIMIVMAITAAAIRSPIPQIVDHGLSPLLVIAAPTAFAALASLAFAFWLL